MVKNKIIVVFGFIDIKILLRMLIYKIVNNKYFISNVVIIILRKIYKNM